ncbi:MAG: hypothetical protein JSR72_09015 [Proteobacteria bacterium]|nr:hypothetical protein [Pseudomonadota bacterium]
MCLACEQSDMEMRWEMINIISLGKLPDGHTADDLRAMGLPVPGELFRETQADGSILIRQRSPQEIAALNNKSFECDSPK